MRCTNYSSSTVLTNLSTTVCPSFSVNFVAIHSCLNRPINILSIFTVTILPAGKELAMASNTPQGLALRNRSPLQGLNHLVRQHFDSSSGVKHGATSSPTPDYAGPALKKE